MDLSKLPKLSDTPKPAEGEGEPASTTSYSAGPLPFSPPSPGECWFAAVVGLIFILFGRSFAGYLLATLSGKAYDTHTTWAMGPKAGQPVSYWELEGFTGLTDTGMFLFGVAVLAETAMLLSIRKADGRSKLILAASMGLGILATGFNLYVGMLFLAKGGMPLMSLLAVGFGGWMVFQQVGYWRKMQTAG